MPHGERPRCRISLEVHVFEETEPCGERRAKRAQSGLACDRGLLEEQGCHHVTDKSAQLLMHKLWNLERLNLSQLPEISNKTFKFECVRLACVRLQQGSKY